MMSLAFAAAVGLTASDSPDVLPPHFECHLHVSMAEHASASAEAHHLSRSHWSKSDFPAALRWAGISVDEAIISEETPQRGRSLNWLGNLFQIMGDIERALEVYEEAEAYMAPTDWIEQAKMKGYRAWHLDSSGHHEAARQLYEDALALAREAGADALIRAHATNLAELLIEHAGSRADLEKAEKYLQEAHATLHGEAPSPGLLLHDAKLARAKGELPRAVAILNEAARKAPVETRWQIDCQLGLIAEARGDDGEAADRYVAAIRVVEELSGAAAKDNRAAPFLQARWEPYQRLLALQHRRGDASGAFATVVQAQGRMFANALALRAMQDLARQGRDNAGAVRTDGLGRILPLLENSLVAGLISADTVLSALRASPVRHVLIYFADKERMRLVAVVDGQPRLTSVDVHLDVLARLIDQFRGHPEDRRAAAELGAAILPEAVLPVTRDERIHIIPTGRLMAVSFAALEVAGERLVDRHEVALAPSVVWLAAMTDRALFGNRRRIVMADSHSDLQRAASELRVVVERTGATPYTGDAVNRDTFRSAAGSALLHVISHSGRSGRGGHLALTSGDIGAADILEWGVDPRLVVLPTCGSAATAKVEMWDSLAAAFLAAGSRNVVATLTSVQDEVAAEFTDHFYRHGGVDDPIGATRRAQRELARSQSAATWSAFVVTGL